MQKIILPIHMVLDIVPGVFMQCLLPELCYMLGNCYWSFRDKETGPSRGKVARMKLYKLVIVEAFIPTQGLFPQWETHLRNHEFAQPWETINCHKTSKKKVKVNEELYSNTLGSGWQHQEQCDSPFSGGAKLIWLAHDWTCVWLGCLWEGRGRAGPRASGAHKG